MYDFTYIWNLKNKTKQNKSTNKTKQKQTQIQETNCCLPEWGGVKGWEK